MYDVHQSQAAAAGRCLNMGVGFLLQNFTRRYIPTSVSRSTPLNENLAKDRCSFSKLVCKNDSYKPSVV